MCLAEIMMTRGFDNGCSNRTLKTKRITELLCFAPRIRKV
jgi:hypothetical protein